MKLKYTRAMITAALNSESLIMYENHKVFLGAKPQSCPNVPSEILNPRNTWGKTQSFTMKSIRTCSKFKKILRNLKNLPDYGRCSTSIS
jgi:phosphoenolpyruvate carboxykinase (ATP)